MGVLAARGHHAERLGFASLRVSDHLQSVTGDRAREGLPAWSALHLAAEWKDAIELGTLVSPMTFYEPGVLLREAEAIDQLSGGRLIARSGGGLEPGGTRAVRGALPRLDVPVRPPGARHRADAAALG